MRKALLISIWQLCAIFTPLFTSQALSGWIGADTHFSVCPQIFDWVQAQTLAGPLKDVQRVVCFGSLSCWKVKLLPSLRFWILWTGFSLRQSQYFGALSFSVPAAENSHTARGCYQHTLLLGCTLQVMSRTGSLQTWCLELKFIRPENLVSQSRRVL